MAKLYTIILLTLFFSFSSTLLYSQYSNNKNIEKFTSKKIENTQDFEVSVFPNPVQSGDYITIQMLNFDNEKPVRISIINIIGKELLNTTVLTPQFKYQMQKEKYPAGIYILRAKQNNEVRTLRLNVVR